MMYVYVDDVYVYDNASSPEVLGTIMKWYHDEYALKGHKVRFDVQFGPYNLELEEG